MSDTIFPKYFLVENEIYVKVDELAGSVIGTNDLGNPYPPIKAIGNGVEISKTEFEEGSVQRRKDYPPSRLRVSS